MQPETYKVIIESLIVIFAVLIHPNFSQSDRVLLDNVHACPPLVWATLSENVTHM